VLLTAIALAVGARHQVGEVPSAVLVWGIVGACIAIGAALGARRSWLAAVLGCVLGFQALMMAYSNFPPVRNSKDLVALARPSIGPQTQLFSVNQYRQGVPPYLGRTLRMVMYRGELAFGLDQDGAGFIPTLEQFIDERRGSIRGPRHLQGSACAECADAPRHAGRSLGRRGQKVSSK
jgi:hypothetical protein